MLCPSLQKIFFLFFIQILTDFGQHTKADVIKNCTAFSYCIDSYADIYKSLTAEDNSFNIESALYPATMPSSLVVKVQIYGPNNTFVANYTWSMNCLYVALPADVLELLSLWSLLVKPRTQDLSICLPSFCHNFSRVEEQKKLMKGVLAALQDLAVSPGLRDPTLNTAECVIEGHKPDIKATGRSVNIRIILWCAFVFAFPAGIALTIETLTFLEKNSKRSSLFCWCKCKCSNCNSCKLCDEQQDPKVSSIILLCFLLFSFEAVILGLVFSLSASGNAPWDIYPILGLLVVLPTVIFLVNKVWSCCAKDDPPEPNGGESGIQMRSTSYSPNGSPQVSATVDEPGIQLLGTLSSQSTETTNKRCCCIWNGLIELMIRICASLTAYHFCWLVIGAMINPVWGLTLLLLVFFVIVVLTFTLYLIFSGVSKFDHTPEAVLYVLYILCLFFGFCSLNVLAISAAKVFSGAETAYDVLKTALAAVITVIITWAVKKWKKSV